MVSIFQGIRNQLNKKDNRQPRNKNSAGGNGHHVSSKTGAGNPPQQSKHGNRNQQATGKNQPGVIPAQIKVRPGKAEVKQQASNDNFLIDFQKTLITEFQITLFKAAREA